MKNIRLGDIFTDDELARALEIYRTTRKSPSFEMVVDRIEKEVVIPCIDRIDFVTGQDNLPAYFAWMLVHWLQSTRGQTV